jgi:tRNA 2-thiouridine synthesizing protein A
MAGIIAPGASAAHPAARICGGNLNDQPLLGRPFLPDRSERRRRPMTEKTLNLQGLKCPLPALRTRKALSGMAAGDILVIECTDPLTNVDIPTLLNQTGDTLEDKRTQGKVITFRIRKR